MMNLEEVYRQLHAAFGITHENSEEWVREKYNNLFMFTFGLVASLALKDNLNEEVLKKLKDLK